MDQLQILQQQMDKLQRMMNDLNAAGQSTATLGGAVSTVDFVPVPGAPAAPPASNVIRNGDFSHSTNTWFESVAAPATDRVLECAHWFTDEAPAAGQALSFINSLTSSANDTLKTPTHSTYDPEYPDWSVPAGIARMTGNKSMNAPFPANSVYPGRPMYLGAIIALRNSTIVMQTDNRISAMLYDNTSGSEDIIQADTAFSLDGQVRGTPAGTTERKYKILAETDRGYSFLSEELVLASAPDDSSFASGSVDVYLSWQPISGVLRYKVYRHDTVAAKFRLLYSVTSGTPTYGDNNRQDDDDVGSYPTADYDRIMCIVATIDGELSNLPVDGVALNWAGLFLNVPVPAPLLSVASGAQVLRLFLAKAMDRQMVDVISTAASNSVESATAEFTTLDTGRIATLSDTDGNVLHGPEAITFVDATHVTFATNVASSNVDAVLYIEEGGDHGLLIDMVHIGYLSRAAYAPYFEDLNRALPSTAAPNTSGQGGVGPPGGDGTPGTGGIGGCVEISCPVAVMVGNDYEPWAFSKVPRGQVLKSGDHVPNYVSDIIPGETDNLHIVRTANGIELPCSPGQVLFSSLMDRRGIPVSRLKIGDHVVTCLDGRDACSKIVDIIATGRRAKVGTFVLAPGHRYLAGRLYLPWWKRLLRWLQGKRGINMIYVHNVKLDQFDPGAPLP